MDVLRLGGKGFHLPGHAVIKPRADGDQHVAVIDRHVRVPGTVHAEHAHATADRIPGKAPRPCSVVVTGQPSFRASAAQLFCGIRMDDPAADIQHRPLRGVDHVRGLLDLLAVSLHGRVVGGQIHAIRIFEDASSGP